MNARAALSSDMLQPLAAYGISPQTGFVPEAELPRSLPAPYRAWDEVAADLPGLIRSGRIRPVLDGMAPIGLEPLETEEDQERALLVLTMLANAWVWAGDTPHLRIPRGVAMPLCELAARLDRPCITHYGSMALRNWRRLASDEPVSADNATMQLRFLGGVDEEWFFIGSMGVEVVGAPLLRTIHAATAAGQDIGDEELCKHLHAVAQEMQHVTAALERMREWCDPYIFYNRVRNFVAGWPEPGVVYEGVSETPRKYIGGSAGQSSLIQSVDAFLGVRHDGQSTGAYFQAMRRYMPVRHRRFLTDVERLSPVPRLLVGAGPHLQQAYNAALHEVDEFRAAHRRMAHDFITVPSGVANDQKGTGGTSLNEFLRHAQLETQRRRI